MKIRKINKYGINFFRISQKGKFAAEVFEKEEGDNLESGCVEVFCGKDQIFVDESCSRMSSLHDEILTKTKELEALRYAYKILKPLTFKKLTEGSHDKT